MIGWYGRQQYKWWVAAVFLAAFSSLFPAVAQESDLAQAQRLHEQIHNFQYHAKEQYGQAIRLAQGEQTITEQIDPDSLDTARMFTHWARVFEANADYVQAEQNYQYALEITKQVLGPEHPITVICRNNLAKLYDSIGDYANAERLYKRVLDIKEQQLGREHPGIAVALDNLASVYQDTGAYERAKSLFEREREITERIGPDSPDNARSLNNLAKLYRDTGAYDEAERLFQRAREIDEKLCPDCLETAAILNNLAELYSFIGDYAKAKPLYQRALDIKEQKLGREDPEVAVSLNNLASLYRATGDDAKAERYYQRALAIFDKALGPGHPSTVPALHNLAWLYYNTVGYDKAEPFFERAQRIVEIATSRFLLSGSEERKREYLQQRVKNVYASASLSLAVADPRAKALGLTAVLQYKGRVLDAMAGSVALLRRSAAPADQALFDKLAAVAQRLSALTFGGRGQLSAQAYRDRLDSLAREQERLEGELSARSAAFRRVMAPVTLDGVRKALPADAVLVEWFRYQPFDLTTKDEKSGFGAPPHYVAYVLRREGDPAAIDLGPAQDIDKLVGEFRLELSDPERTAYKEVGQKLFVKLIKPLQPALSGINRLLLSPDGNLNLIPFAGLINANGEYVAQHFEITYLTSGRDLLTLAAPEPARGPPVVMADPDYGESTSGPPSNLAAYRSIDMDRSGLVFTPLTGTAGEAKSLQRLLKLDAQEVLTGADATEEKLKGLHSPRILHVATHGFFLDDQQVATLALRPASFSTSPPPLPLMENPLLRSGLALAGANARHSGKDDDGILTAAEAAQLDLRGTQLVVLSACETGLGQVQQGEGVYGLRRALVLAGAQTQLVSLWKVADARTQALMVDYYERLLKGEGRSAALREAQKAMIANPATHHPHYWAAFLTVGNWMPLVTKGMEQPE